MSPSIYLISGANRGIGLGLVIELVKRQQDVVVFAGARNPESATALNELAKAHAGHVHVVKLVSRDVEGNRAVVQEIKEKYGRLDVVIANAAIQSFLGSVLETSPEIMTENFEVNVNGVLVLFQATFELLKASKSPKFIPITSGAASIGAAAAIKAGFLSYAASKAALNYLTRKIHFENEWIIAFPLAPGMVATDMGASALRLDQTGSVAQMASSMGRSVEDASKDVIDIIENATREKDGGEFINVDGTKIPW